MKEVLKEIEPPKTPARVATSSVRLLTIAFGLATASAWATPAETAVETASPRAESETTSKPDSLPAAIEAELDVVVEKQLKLGFVVQLPSGYDDDARAWPLIFFLHGAGERGADLDLVRKHGPPKLRDQGQEIPAVIVSPQCPDGERWTDHLDALSALLDEVEQSYRIDSSRIYLTGLSMGGYGTWALATAEPDRFAAAVPVCGGGSGIAGRRLLELPIWAFHGEEDHVVPVSESTRLVELLRRRGGDQVKLTTYPGVGHDSWESAYSEPELWQWLFDQRRPTP